jgi:hypothetical protein
MNTEELAGWFAGRIPDEWFEGAPEVTVDRDEILVVGRLPAPDLGDSSEAARSTAESSSGRLGERSEQESIEAWREETRGKRIEIASEAERRFRRKVSWGAECGETRGLFTTFGAPVMTRLRQPERRVLDTLVEAGVARSRSHALAWCVHLVGKHEADWIADLNEALTEVEKVRAKGPSTH